MAQAKYLNSAIRSQTTGASAQPSTTPLRQGDAELITRFSLASTIQQAAERLGWRVG